MSSVLGLGKSGGPSNTIPTSSTFPFLRIFATAVFPNGSVAILYRNASVSVIIFPPMLRKTSPIQNEYEQSKKQLN